MKDVLVAGSTGLVGRELCRQLVSTAGIDRVVALTRRPLDFSLGPKLISQVADYGNLGQLNLDSVDTAFCTLGTTIKAAGSKEAFRLVDFDYTVAFARFAKKSGARTFVLLTSVDSDPKSPNFYLTVKGEAEKSVAAVGFESLYCVRPSFLMGKRAENRPGEKIGIAIARTLQFALAGPLRKYRPIDVSVLAQGMIRAADRAEPGVHVLHYNELT